MQLTDKEKKVQAGVQLDIDRDIYDLLTNSQDNQQQDLELMQKSVDKYFNARDSLDYHEITSKMISKKFDLASKVAKVLSFHQVKVDTEHSWKQVLKDIEENDNNDFLFPKDIENGIKQDYQTLINNKAMKSNTSLIYASLADLTIDEKCTIMLNALKSCVRDGDTNEETIFELKEKPTTKGTFDNDKIISMVSTMLSITTDSDANNAVHFNSDIIVDKPEQRKDYLYTSTGYGDGKGSILAMLRNFLNESGSYETTYQGVGQEPRRDFTTRHFPSSLYLVRYRELKSNEEEIKWITKLVDRDYLCELLSDCDNYKDDDIMKANSKNLYHIDLNHLYHFTLKTPDFDFQYENPRAKFFDYDKKDVLVCNSQEYLYMSLMNLYYSIITSIMKRDNNEVLRKSRVEEDVLEIGDLDHTVYQDITQKFLYDYLTNYAG